MDKNLINSLIKMFFIILFTMYIVKKALNKKINKKIFIVIILASILLSGLYVAVKYYINTGMAVLTIYILLCYFIKLLEKCKITHSMVNVLISMAICLSFFGIAIGLEFILYIIFHIDNNVINSLLIAFIQGILIFSFFSIKRFKNGLEFLKNRNEYIDIIIINISTIIVYVYYLIGNYYHKTATNMFIMFTFLGLFLISMIKEAFSMQYKQNLLKKTIEEYKKEIEDKDKTINKLKEEKFKISKINHEFYNRQKALETKIKEMNVETGEEIYILDRVNNLTKEYSNKLQEAKGLSKLPSTEISEIDDMFNYMQKECYKNGIEFKLQVTGNINHLINTIIPKNELETLIGDHIRDAIIAVNSSNSTYKSILAVLGIKDGTYEFCVSDTGIEFEIETLLKLGQEQITTHKDIGGSGIGFITTFETLKRCGGSLIIEEYQPEKSSYTKSITIKFDNKNEYKICSYRANEISKRNKENRIIIEEV